MPYISDEMRRQVEERAKGRCEYCQTQRAIVVSMQVDHVRPVADGGETVLENLCLACVSCNGSKLDTQSAVDPETGESVSLFNPRQQDWSDHFSWSDDKTEIVGLTAVGRATVIRLRMNRETIVDARKLWVYAGWHPAE